jgi:hypothetical protein
MNSTPLRVLEFWQQHDREWRRIPEFEIDFEDDDE